MDSNDKTYMWLAIVAFVSLCIATGFALAELNELKGENVSQAKNPFE
jgi:hypothetical protein